MFKTMGEMLKYLSEYREMYYMWIAIDAELTGVKSPSLDAMPGSSHTEADAKILQHMQDKEYYERQMRKIREDIAKLKDVSNMSYRIMLEKFIYFKTLEEIALILHYSLDHVKHNLYPKAKEDLFELLNKEYTEIHL